MLTMLKTESSGLCWPLLRNQPPKSSPTRALRIRYEDMDLAYQVPANRLRTSLCTTAPCTSTMSDSIQIVDSTPQPPVFHVALLAYDCVQRTAQPKGSSKSCRLAGLSLHVQYLQMLLYRDPVYANNTVVRSTEFAHPGVLICASIHGHD